MPSSRKVDVDVPASSSEHGAVSNATAVRALARTEALRLTRHPLVLLGVLLGGIVGWTLSDGQAFVLGRESITFQLALLPLAAGTFVATHLASTRPDRHAVDDLFASTPVRGEHRSVALVVAATAPAMLAAIGAGAGLLATRLLGSTGSPLWIEAATGPVVVWLAGALGVLLGRFVRHPAAAVGGLVVLGAWQLVAGGTGAGTVSRVGLLSPVVTPPDTVFDPWALVRPAVWHLAYILSLVAAVTLWVSRSSHRTGRRFAAVASVGLVVATTGWAQMRQPPRAVATEAAVRVSDPAEVAVCETVETAELCALPGYERWLDRWRPPVAGVLGDVARAGISAPRVRLLQQADREPTRASLERWFADADKLFPERTDPGRGWTTVALGTAWPSEPVSSREQLILGLETAREVVGMPYGETQIVADDGGGQVAFVSPCNAAGQAREVLAVWLAATSYEGGVAALARVVEREPYGLDVLLYESEEGGPGSGGYSLFSGSSQWVLRSQVLHDRFEPTWSKVATNLALQLARRPHHEVMAGFAGQWDRWVDPDTAVRDLVSQFELDPQPTGSDVPGAEGLPESVDDLLLGFRDTPLPADVEGTIPCGVGR